ncbi:MAG: DUF4185 domain-containing protein [Candidatus Omnitrophica bacterium]|nr:DUF4185 domain-containing protein [Candidatus Omnitrophota bacterium]
MSRWLLLFPIGIFVSLVIPSRALAGEAIPSSFHVESVTVDPVYHSLLIPESTGWLGSDAACSIPTSSTHSVWLFGDTLIGSLEGKRRSRDFDFINGTIGIQDRSGDPPGSMTFFWKGDSEKAISFFPHEEGTSGHLYWTTLGLMLGDELFIYAYPIKMGTSEWISDTTLIRVSNPQASPPEWEYTIRDLGIGNTRQGFHSAVYVEEPYAYFLGYNDFEDPSHTRGAVLARIKTADIVAGKGGEAYEYWCESDGNGVWNQEPENLKTLFEPGVTETGLQYIQEWDLFVCPIYSPSDDEILLTASRELTGPWCDPVSIYRIPEHEVSFPIISYAVRPHPELSTKPGEIILTYNTNAVGSTDPLFTEEGYEIYWPRFLRVEMVVE